MEKNYPRLGNLFILIAGLLWPLHLVQAAGSIKVTPKSVNMGSIAVSDFEAGFKEKTRANILIVSDSASAWKVLVKTDNTDMGVVGNYTKPISDFRWRATGNYATQTSYTSIANYEVEAARGPQGSNLLVYIDTEVLLSWARDVPGAYHIILTYTITTQ
jgi:hypothetical protein